MLTHIHINRKKIACQSGTSARDAIVRNHPPEQHCSLPLDSVFLDPSCGPYDKKQRDEDAERNLLDVIDVILKTSFLSVALRAVLMSADEIYSRSLKLRFELLTVDTRAHLNSAGR